MYCAVLVVTNIVRWFNPVIKHGDRKSVKTIMWSHPTFVFKSNRFFHVICGVRTYGPICRSQVLLFCCHARLLVYQSIWESYDGFKEVDNQWWWRVGKEPKPIKKDLVSCCWMITTYPNVAVCRALPAVVGKSAVGLNDFLWQLRRSLVGMSHGHRQFKALDWLPQYHHCCHVQKDDAIFEHFASQDCFVRHPKMNSTTDFSCPEQWASSKLTLSQGFHAVDLQPMCCDKVCLCVDVQCKCWPFFESLLLISTALDQACNPIFEIAPSVKKYWERVDVDLGSISFSFIGQMNNTKACSTNKVVCSVPIQLGRKLYSKSAPRFLAIRLEKHV